MSATNWRTHLAALRLLTLVLLPCLMSSAANISRSKITCQAGQFEIGQAASVTCIFHKNIKESKTGFNVTARFFDTPDVQRSVPVVTCKWIQDGTLYCLLGDGFVPRDMAPTDHLTIDIPQFAHNQAGEYRCEATDDATPTEQCFLLPKYIDRESRTGAVLKIGTEVLFVLGIVVLLPYVLIFLWVMKTLNLLWWKKKRENTNADNAQRERLLTRESEERTITGGYSTAQETPPIQRYTDKKGDIIYTFPPLKDGIVYSTADETHHIHDQDKHSSTPRKPSLNPFAEQVQYGMTRKPHKPRPGTGLERTPLFVNSTVFPYNDKAQKKKE